MIKHLFVCVLRAGVSVGVEVMGDLWFGLGKDASQKNGKVKASNTTEVTSDTKISNPMFWPLETSNVRIG